MAKYISHSDIAFNARLESGGHRHIRFDTLSTGGSTFSTDDPALIEALERLPFYGSLFRREADPEVAVALPPEPIGDLDADPTTIAGAENVTSFAEARAYLKEMGVQGKLMSKAEVAVAAREHGVEFPNLTL